MKKIKRMTCGVLAAVLVAFGARAEVQTNVPYRTLENGQWVTRNAAVCQVVTADTAEFTADTWYVVPAGTPVTCNKTISAKGRVNLILADGSMLDVNDGIGLADGGSSGCPKSAQIRRCSFVGKTESA